MSIETKIDNFLKNINHAEMLSEGVRYDWEHHKGGVILYDRQTGRDIFLQPGDDSNQFLDEINDGNLENEDIQDAIRNYFENIEDND